jgi:hypothetical protein
MTIVSSGQLTISDLNDARQLVLYLNPNYRTQVYDPNTSGSTAYAPDFTSANCVITPELYIAGGGSTNLMASSSIKSVTWYEGTTRVITDGATSTGADAVSTYTIPSGSVATVNKTLTMKTNLVAKNSQKFTCIVVYTDSILNADITMKSDVEIVKITNGVKGGDGTGTDAVMALLDNETATIPADYTGLADATSLALAKSSIKIIEGNADITNTYTIALGKNPTDTTKFNVTTSGTPANSTIQVSTMSTDTKTASVTFTGTRTGYPTLTKTFNITKLNAGKNGDDATTYFLQFPYALSQDNQGNYRNTSLKILAFSKAGTASQVAYNGYISVETSTDGTTWTSRVANTTQLTSGAYTYPASGSFPTGMKFIKVKLFSASGGTGQLDEQTCTVIQDGFDTIFNNVWAPNGDTIRNSSGTLTLQSDLYKGNTVLTTGVTYQWYAQDPTVTNASSLGSGGDLYGGNGWRTLQTLADPSTALPTANVNVATAGGTLTGGTYFIRYTWLSTNGETKPSPVMATGVVVPANYNMKITIPAFPTGAYLCNIYVGTASGQERFQGNLAPSGGNVFTITAPISTTATLASTITTNKATYTQGTSFYTTSTLTVPASAITGMEGFKCVAFYGTLGYSGVAVVKDITDPILTKVEGVDIFKNGDGTNTYKATLVQAGTEIDSLGNSGYTYTWYIYNNDGTKTSFSKTGKTITVSATDITIKGNLVCEVSK